MTQHEKQQLAAEFTRLKHDAKRLPAFAWENQDLISTALTQWAQQDEKWEVSLKRLAVAAARENALEEAEQACRARVRIAATRADYHASPTLVTRANEADECADAIARLKEPQ